MDLKDTKNDADQLDHILGSSLVADASSVVNKSLVSTTPATDPRPQSTRKISRESKIPTPTASRILKQPATKLLATHIKSPTKCNSITKIPSQVHGLTPADKTTGEMIHSFDKGLITAAESTTSSSPKNLLTKPQAPNFHKSHRARQESTGNGTTMADQLQSFGKGLQTAAESTTSSPKNFLTKPQAPTFHTSRRARRMSAENVITMAEQMNSFSNGLRSSAEMALPMSTVTKSQAPNFHTSHRARRESAENVTKMAEQMNSFGKGLRTSAESSPRGSPSKITQPKGPKFHQIHHRELPKSTEELEAELLMNTIQFKARPIPKFPRPLSPTHSNLPTTETRPFIFESDKRVNRKPIEPTPNPEDEDLIELEKQFKARPMPQFKATPSLEQNGGSGHSVTKTSDDLTKGTAVPFQVRPLPLSTYVAPSLQPRPVIPTNVEQPDHAPMPAASSASVSTTKPFELQSVQRHQAYREKKARERQQQLEEERKLSTFQALPLPKPVPRQEPRMKNAKKELQQLQKQDNEKSARVFHARPLPKCLQKTNPTNTSETNEAMQEQQATDDYKRFYSLREHPTHWLLVFVGLCIFRVFNTLLIQSYFDPDEFWQTLEPAYCAVYSPGDLSCPGYTWEWTRRSPTPLPIFPTSTANLVDFVQQSMLGPARSFVSVIPTYLLYLLAKAWKMDSAWLIARGPMVLNAVTIAAPSDFCVWYAARWLRSPEKTMRAFLPAWCLFCSLVSWFNGYSMIRTFANSQETFLIVASVALVSPELIGNETRRWSLWRACLAFLLGGISVAIRFTSLSAFVPMGFLLSSRQQSLQGEFAYLILPCATFGLTGLFISMLVDKWFFGFWTLPFLGNFHFNVILNNAGLYGTHAWHWYFSAGFPAVAGLLTLFVCADLCGRGSASYGKRNIWIIVISYLVILSFNSHKEFRFIHPILPLVCLLVGPTVRTVFLGSKGQGSRSRFIFFATLFILPNLIAVLYLGLFHQIGPILVNRKIRAVAQSARTRLMDIGDPQTEYSIFYWTGGCHSTPLHSHLHSPPLHFHTWHLDCSPECRAKSQASACESMRFDTDPSAFVEEVFCEDDTPESVEVLDLDNPEGVCIGLDGEPTTCGSNYASIVRRSEEHACPKARYIPDFVVTLSRYTRVLAPHFEMAGLKEIARFPIAIKCIHLFGFVIGDEFGQREHRTFNTKQLAKQFKLDPTTWGFFEVSLEDMVLYSSQREGR
jgi:phosphatidylinositol glycan class B